MGMAALCAGLPVISDKNKDNSYSKEHDDTSTQHYYSLNTTGIRVYSVSGMSITHDTDTKLIVGAVV